MSGSVERPLLAALAALGIDWTLIEHEPVFTVEESADLHARLLGVHTKNLFLKDAGSAYWLVTAPHDASIDLKALAPLIGAKKLSFGKADEMFRLLGVTPGAVTPLAALNDGGTLVQVVLDTRVATAATAYVHAFRNTATIGLSGADLVAALSAWRHSPAVIVVPDRITAA